MNELALFAGAGGGILGGQLLGWKTVCAVEIEPYPASVLLQRQNDGLLPAFPIWDDVCTFDGKPWRGIVDVVSGGFPCQDISAAGKGAGITGERSGLWKEFARIICEVRPRYVFVENSPILTSRGIDVVLGDLATLGYDVEWGVLGADEVGAPHKRERVWIVAYPGCERARYKTRKTCSDKRRNIGRNEPSFRQTYRKNGTNRIESTSEFTTHGKSMADHLCERLEKRKGENTERTGEIGRAEFVGDKWWSIEPDVGRVADGVAARVDRLKAIGNGQVPQCAAEAFRRLYSRIKNE